jgi:putative transposase
MSVWSGTIGCERKVLDFDKVVKRAAAIFELKPEEILSAGKQRLRVRVRSVLCYWAVKELGMSGTSVAKLLNIGQPAVSRTVGKGENLVAEMNLKLISSRKA